MDHPWMASICTCPTLNPKLIHVYTQRVERLLTPEETSPPQTAETISPSQTAETTSPPQTVGATSGCSNSLGRVFNFLRGCYCGETLYTGELDVTTTWCANEWIEYTTVQVSSSIKPTIATDQHHDFPVAQMCHKERISTPLPAHIQLRCRVESMRECSAIQSSLHSSQMQSVTSDSECLQPFGTICAGHTNQSSEQTFSGTLPALHVQSY